MTRRHTSLMQALQAIFLVGWSDFVLKYHGTVLGYLWSLIGPVVKFAVIYYVTRPLVSAGIPNYPLYLFLGIILFEHFSNTTNGCLTMLFAKEGIISKIAFPRILLILTIGWTNMLVFFTYLAIFVGFSWMLGALPTWQYLLLPLLLIQMTLLSLGVGMALCAYSLKFRDLEHLWSLVLYVLFWMTPIFYQYPSDGPLWKSLLHFIDQLGVPTLTRLFDGFVRYQPLSILINDARRTLLYGQTVGAPSPVHVVVFTGICVLIFCIGAVIFQRRSPYFLQEY